MGASTRGFFGFYFYFGEVRPGTLT